MSDLPEVLDLVGGEATLPAVDLGVAIRSPNDGAILDRQRATDPRTLDHALGVAARAHARGDWAHATADERAAVLEAIAAALEPKVESIATADATTTGAVIGLTRLVAGIVPHAFRGAAALLRGGFLGRTLPGPGGAPVEIVRAPWGPAAVIAPWNAPSGIAAHKIASALAAGCPVVAKPSEWAPHSLSIIGEVLRASALPAGIFQLVHGAAEVGAALVSDRRIRAVSFTGGLSGGLAVARACAADLKPVQLELGGNNPLLVLDDADLDRAAAGIVAGLVTLNAQWCRAVGRIFVASSRHDALLERVLDRLARVRVGSSLDPESEMGPLVHAAHRARVAAAVDRLIAAGGHVHQTTKVPVEGCFFPPTLVTGVAAADAEEEIFGPVATVHVVESDAEAIALANASPYGLAAYVFGADHARARSVARRLQAGSTKIDGVSLMSLHPAAPRPAWGHSGFGEEGTTETLAFFCGTRVIGVAQ
jgi:phenylacetaldehyde dehydrogenase